MADTLFSKVPSPTALPDGVAGTHRHGHQRADDAFDVLAAGQEQLAEPVGDAGQHDVVEGPAERLAHRLDVVDRGGRPRVAPVRAERAVEARERHRPDQAAQGERGRRPPRRRSRRPGAGRGSGPAPPAAARRGRAPCSRAPRRPARGLRARGGVPMGMPATGAACRAERSMMTASRSVPDTPSTSAWCVLARMAQRSSSRPSTTQISHRGLVRSSCWAMTRPTSLRSSVSPPGRGERGVAQVVLDVEVRVVDPDGPAELEGHESHLLAVARHEVELGVDHLDHVGEGRRRSFEDRHRGDVHVRDVVLDVEERGVQGAQPVRAHTPSLRGPPAGRLLPRCRRPRGSGRSAGEGAGAVASVARNGVSRGCAGGSPRRRPR